MKLTRPPFVLAFPGDLAGCGYHRVIRPLRILGRNGLLAGRGEVNFPTEQLVEALKPDVIVWQRQSEVFQVETIERYRKVCPDAFFVFEIDDALSAVPDKSWHKPYMTPNIDAKLAYAIPKCDVITVTTPELAEHMRKISGNTIPVRVVPNMIGRDDIELATQVRKELMFKDRSTPKLRVGFGGGISHAGDLELLHDVFVELRNEVEWCFLGMDPEMPVGVDKTYFGAVVPDRYLASLAGINVDLIIAPLEDNLFNRCKSNLRLIEAGACMYPVIASPVAPYHTDSPPVFAYADTPEAWVRRIRDFISLTAAERQEHGDEMHRWVLQHYIMDDADKAERRLLGWLPDHTRIFKPKLNSVGSGVEIVSNAAEFKAAYASSNDILYARPGAKITPDAKERLLKSDLAVTCGLTNEGGPWGFPDIQRFTPIDQSIMDQISAVMPKFIDAVSIPLNAVSGPVVYIKRAALDTLGCPDLDSYTSLEMCLLEWTSGVRSLGLKIGLCPSVFVGVDSQLQPPEKEAQYTAIRITGRWPQGDAPDGPLQALREEVEIAFHAANYRALPPQNHSDYPAWAETCDMRGPESCLRAEQWVDEHCDERDIALIAYPAKTVSTPVSEGADWVLFVPSKAQLAPDYEAVATLAIEHHPNAEIIYFDHDFIVNGKTRVNPDFKPNFDLHMLLSRDYMTQALLIRRGLLARFPEGEVDDCVLYDVLLNYLATIDNARAKIAHEPRILLSLEPPNASEQLQSAPFKLDSVNKFIAISRWRIEAKPHPSIPFLRELHYASRVDGNSPPKVAIVIPCKDNVEMLAPCINTVLAMTKYENFQIFIVDNGSERKEMLDFQESLSANPKVTLLSWPYKYSWSALNNWAVNHILEIDKDFEYLCFLNDDTRVLSPCWLSEMVGAATIPEVGAVGARLTYPHGQVQHVGVVAQSGLTGHIHKGLPVNHPGVQGYAIISHEASAVTGACLVVSRDKFYEVGCFTRELPTNFNDVAFCLDLYNIGLVNVVAAKAELHHLEGVTRNAKGLTQDALDLLHSEGAILAKLHPEPDPYWNPNLVITYVQSGRQIAGMDMACYAFPAPKFPWTETDTIRSVLVIGSPEGASQEIHDDYSIYRLEIHGNTASIRFPPLVNCGPWDIRRPEIASAAFKKIGFERVILTQLGESPIQTLQFLRRLDIPVEYHPLNAESVCPRGDFLVSGTPCAQGYKTNSCQACIDANSSPQGNVLIGSWLSEWIRFLNSPIRADLSHLTDLSYREALEYVFSGQGRDS